MRGIKKQPTYLIRLSNHADDWGLYLHRYRNPITNTSLAVRGTHREVESWMDEQDRLNNERRKRLGLA